MINFSSFVDEMEKIAHSATTIASAAAKRGVSLEHQKALPVWRKLRAAHRRGDASEIATTKAKLEGMGYSGAKRKHAPNVQDQHLSPTARAKSKSFNIHSEHNYRAAMRKKPRHAANHEKSMQEMRARMEKRAPVRSESWDEQGDRVMENGRRGRLEEMSKNPDNYVSKNTLLHRHGILLP